MPRPLTIDDVLLALEAGVLMEGGVRAFARKSGLSPAYISRVKNRQIVPGPRLLTALGFKRNTEIVVDE